VGIASASRAMLGTGTMGVPTRSTTMNRRNESLRTATLAPTSRPRASLRAVRIKRS
jgi:hypothetical protein